MNLTNRLQKIKILHEDFCKGSAQIVRKAAEIGALLIEAKEMIPHGEFEEAIRSIGMSKVTAWNYRRVAEAWDAKKGMLDNGIKLCDLYREIGVLPPLKGGGARLGKQELARRRETDQLVFHFDRIQPIFREVLGYQGGNPLFHVEMADREQIRAAAQRLLDWADEAGKPEVET